MGIGKQRAAWAAGALLLAAWFGFIAGHRQLLVGQIGLQAFSAQQPGVRLVDVHENADLLDPPLLTFALKALGLADIHPYAGVKIIHAAACVVAALLLFALVKRAMGREAAAFALALYLALPLFNSVLSGSETHALLHVFILLALREAWRIAESPGAYWRAAALMGLWSGLAYLSRFEGMLYFALFWGAAIAWTWKRDGRFPRALFAAWPAFMAPVFFYLLVIRLETDLWQGTQIVAHNLLYAPIRLSLFQTETLAPEQVWGDGPRTFLGAFLHSPGMMAERMFVNFRNMLLILGSLKGIPLYFWPFLGAGLFAAGIKEWERGAALRVMLLLGLVPAFAYLPFHWEERYLAPTGMLLLPWAGAGFAAVRRELAERMPGRRTAVSWAAWLAFAAMAAVPLAVSLQNLLSHPVPHDAPHVYHHRDDVKPLVLDAAEWIRENAPQDTLIVSPHLLWAAHTGRALLPFSPADAMSGEEGLRAAVAAREAERRPLWLVAEEELFPTEARERLAAPPAPWKTETRFGEAGKGITVMSRTPLDD